MEEPRDSLKLRVKLLRARLLRAVEVEMVLVKLKSRSESSSIGDRFRFWRRGCFSFIYR